ncbi:Deleted in malignant brain tumors 1 protein, partial [Stylophora pistillata]
TFILDSVCRALEGTASYDSLIELEFGMLFFAEGGKPEDPEKNPRSKDENQQQTQPTCDARSGNRTRATVVGGECSHHCAIPAPQGTRNKADKWLETKFVACGDRLTGASGTFSSPQYPLNYPINANCVWRINVTRGFAVNFTFIDFDTESCCDRLHIRNGDVLLDSYGGNLSNFTVGPIAAVSNNAEIEVSFTSDNSVRRKGFVAYYNIFALP